MFKPFCSWTLAGSLLVIAGCDQIESSSKQLLNTAATSAKQVIDDTHEVATQALEDARQKLSMLEPETALKPPVHKQHASDQDI